VGSLPAAVLNQPWSAKEQNLVQADLDSSPELPWNIFLY